MPEPNDSADQQNAPAADAVKPMTEAEAADSLADLLDDDAQIVSRETKSDRKATKDDKEEHEASEEEDPLGPDDDEEDVEENDADAEADGSQDRSTAGKYVSATAKYKLADGTEITVGDLARNNLFQRDYSKKTEDLARERESFTKEKEEIVQLSRTVSEERQFLLWFAEKHVPQQPVPPTLGPDQDPIGHLKYQDEVRKYSEFVQAYQMFKQGADTEIKRKDGETQAQANKRASEQVAQLFAKLKIDPQKQPAKAQAFFNAVAQGANEFYGLDETTIANLAKQDHRALLILRDAIRARQNKKSAPDVQAQLRNVPKIRHQPTARVAPNAREEQSRLATKEKLQRSGSLNDGIAAIEALL